MHVFTEAEAQLMVEVIRGHECVKCADLVAEGLDGWGGGGHRAEDADEIAPDHTGEQHDQLFGKREAKQERLAAGVQKSRERVNACARVPRPLFVQRR